MHKIAAATILAVLVLCGDASGAAAKESRRYFLNTDFGPLSLRVNFAEGWAEGQYPKSFGRLFGHVSPSGRGIEGMWVQDRADRACASQRRGSWFWGHFAFAYDLAAAPGTPMSGVWGYCDEPLDSAWNGVFVN